MPKARDHAQFRRCEAPTALLRECRDCGRLVSLPGPDAQADPGPSQARPRDAEARCPRCGATLRRRGTPLSWPLALGLAAVPIYAAAVSLPFLELQKLGRIRESWIGSSTYTLYAEGEWGLSAVVLLTLVAMPLLVLGLLLTALVGLRMRQPPQWLHVPARLYGRARPWAMPEVFLFGGLVSYTRLADLAQVRIEPAAWGVLALAALLVALDLTLDPDALWGGLARSGATHDAPHDAPAAGRHADPLRRHDPTPRRRIACSACELLPEAREGDPCPRCGAVLRSRRPDSVARTWALVAAAALLYGPANYYPVMEITMLGKERPYTILGGIRDFLDAGLWPLALVVFLASFAVPLLKLTGLLWMLLGIHLGSAAWLRGRTRLYRVVLAIGRWSMIDVFVVSILVPLVAFDQIATIRVGLGAACFAAVVVLTIFAADSFDPRLMWDAAGGRGRTGAARG